MWFRRRKNITVFNNPLISEMDEKICSILKVKLIASDSEILEKISEEEQNQSGIKTLELLSLFEKENEELTKFICYSYSLESKVEKKLDRVKKEDRKTVGLGKGFSITYGIYYYFLKNKKKKEFLDYLSKRKIPQHREFYERLENYFFQSKGVMLSESYIQYAGGYNKEDVNNSDIQKALNDLKVMDEEHGAFWISMLVENDEEFIIEVNKNLKLSLIFGENKENYYQAKNYEEVKNILELHIKKDFEKINEIVKN
jgi:hypothetical protein